VYFAHVPARRIGRVDRRSRMAHREERNILKTHLKDLDAPVLTCETWRTFDTTTFVEATKQFANSRATFPSASLFYHVFTSPSEQSSSRANPELSSRTKKQGREYFVLLIIERLQSFTTAKWCTVLHSARCSLFNICSSDGISRPTARYLPSPSVINQDSRGFKRRLSIIFRKVQSL